MNTLFAKRVVYSLWILVKEQMKRERGTETLNIVTFRNYSHLQ